MDAMSQVSILSEYKDRFLNNNAKRDIIKIMRENKLKYHGIPSTSGKKLRLPQKTFENDQITEEDEQSRGDKVEYRFDGSQIRTNSDIDTKSRDELQGQVIANAQLFKEGRKSQILVGRNNNLGIQ